jgi:hypothetical protein
VLETRSIQSEVAMMSFTRPCLALRTVVATVVMISITGCGASEPDPPDADSSIAEPAPDASESAEAPEESETPPPAEPEFEIPATLDESKFCKALDRGAMQTAAGVAVSAATTQGSDPEDLYCRFANKKLSHGVNIVWNRNPTSPVGDLRKILEGDPTYVEAQCAFSEVGSLDPELAVQVSCAGYDRTGAAFPKREELYFQLDQGLFYCQVYAPAKQDLAVDAGGAASLCQDAVTSLT